jgi:hypothetical protein
MKKRNRFPKGWNEDRVQGVLEHYESQTEEEAVAEDEAAFRKRDYTIMVVSESTRTQNHKAGGARENGRITGAAYSGVRPASGIA